MINENLEKTIKNKGSNEINSINKTFDRPQVSADLDPSAEIHAETRLEDDAAIEVPDNNFKAHGTSIKTNDL